MLSEGARLPEEVPAFRADAGWPGKNLIQLGRSGSEQPSSRRPCLHRLGLVYPP